MRATSPPSPNRSKPPWRCCGGVFDWDQAQVRLDELNALSERPDFWNDSEKAQKLMRERNKLDAAMNAILSLERDLADNLELAEMAEAEGDAGLVDEAHAALKRAQARAAQAELEALLSGEADGNDAFIEINSGAGGTESRIGPRCCCMYARWANARASRWKSSNIRTAKPRASNRPRCWCRAKTPMAG